MKRSNDIESRLAAMSRHELRTVLLDLLTVMHGSGRMYDEAINDILRDWNLGPTTTDDEDDE